MSSIYSTSEIGLTPTIFLDNSTNETVEPPTNFWDNSKNETIDYSTIRWNNFRNKSPASIVVEFKETLGVAWDIHMYCVTIFSGLCALMSLAMIIILSCQSKSLHRGYYVALSVLILTFSAIRTVTFAMNPYNVTDSFHDSLQNFVINISLPTLTSAFGFLFGAILKTTKFKRVSDRVFKTWVLISVMVFNLVLTIVADVVVGLYLDAGYLHTICACVFAVWGFIFSLLFFYLFFKLYKQVVVDRRKIFNSNNLSTMGSSVQNSPNAMKKDSTRHKQKIPVALKITLIAAICFIGISVLNCYTVAKMFLPDKLGMGQVGAWAWWTEESIRRLLELIMALIILFVTGLPIMNKWRH